MNSEIIGIVESLNPLGFIENMYARKLSYKLETRKLRNEMESMRVQADLYMRKLGVEYEIRMEQIRLRRVEVEAMLKNGESELERLSITREQVLRLAEGAQKKALADGISIEERDFYAGMSYEYIRQLHVFGESSRKSLKYLLGSVGGGDDRLQIEGKR